MMRRVLILLLIVSFLAPFAPTHAQEELLVASLEVINASVDVKRVDTDVWIPVTFETLLAQGDMIRTDEEGEAIITFFADGTSTELQPETEVIIADFRVEEEAFTITLEILAGITIQQVERILDQDSSYRVITPGVNMTVRGTDFAVRVEEDGRSSLLTFDGQVNASDTPVDGGFGVRAVDGELSDVVSADSFEALDTALDGCVATSSIQLDVQLNVRSGPATSNDVIATIPPSDIETVYGTIIGNTWYRIQLDDGSYGWIAADAVGLADECPLLRQFPVNYVEE
ncbi:MAG: FecR domain-containing protein [Chloroflexi bacterium]|nr:FecR domain-containing protein [Chloroflexota bacterium]